MAFVKENPILVTIGLVIVGSVLFNAFNVGSSDPMDWLFPVIGVALAYFGLGALT